MTCMPSVTFNNGQRFPVIGLGTWQSKPDEIVCQAVRDAIDMGYRHIDCAHIYGNETGIGKAIQAKIQDGTIKCRDLYVTSKLWCTMHRPDLVEPAIRTTLKNLRRGQLELYLMHWPLALKEDGELYPTNPDGTVAVSDVDYIDTWKAMEKLQEEGLTKSIGISNFNEKQVQRLLENCSIMPVTNQIESHPYLTQNRLIRFCKSKNIVITVYAPLGSPGSIYLKSDQPRVLKDCRVVEMAANYHKTPAQLLLRYQIQKGHIVIPKSANKDRLQENLNIWDFAITCEDIARLDSLDCNQRSVGYEETSVHKDYPWKNGC